MGEGERPVADVERDRALRLLELAVSDRQWGSDPVR
jgi:hypothetical protein